MTLSAELPAPKKRTGRPNTTGIARPRRTSESRRDPSDWLQLQAGANIKKYRKLRGLTLQRLSTMCHTTPQTMQRLESANMTLSMHWLQILSKALDVQPHLLLVGGDSDPMIQELAAAKLAAARAHMQLKALRAMLRELTAAAQEIVPEDDGGAQ